MKTNVRSVVLIGLALLSCESRAAITLSGSLANGLVAYYSFDGNADDSVGINNGTPSGATLTADRLGNSNSAYSFDGISSTITGIYGGAGNDVPSPLTGSFTCSLWFKATQPISIVGEAATGTTYAAFVGNINNPYWSVGGSGIGISAGTNGVTVFEYAHQYIAPVIVSPQILDSSWNHAVVTVENDGAPLLYLNGTYIETGLITGRQKFLTLLDMSDSGYGKFAGSLDEIAIYDRALSPAEVSGLYDVQSIPEPGSMIGIGCFLASGLALRTRHKRP